MRGILGAYNEFSDEIGDHPRSCGEYDEKGKIFLLG